MIEKLLKKLTWFEADPKTNEITKKTSSDTVEKNCRNNSSNNTVHHQEVQDLRNAEKAMEKLNSLVGLKEVKEQVEKLTAFAWMMRVRELQGLVNQPLSLHMAFKGNPGTGKTTVARILGEVLYSVGVLETPTVVEVSRSDLIGEYIGQSLPKVNKVISRARGGILLIDEAYSVVRSDSMRDYGYEVLDHLVKVMEDRRDEFMIIFTGYKKELDDFLEINTGLKSRINYHMCFPDYTGEELVKIFLILAKERGFDVTSKAIGKLKEILVPNPDNGRFVRNVLERTIMKKATNLYKNKQLANLKTISEEDIAVPPKEMKKGVVGFIK
ncbi:MAG TPA: AAA family ATPase [Clostridia bacterium]|nr:AAA family ATPase [Clostridia bacterium]